MPRQQRRIARPLGTPSCRPTAINQLGYGLFILFLEKGFTAMKHIFKQTALAAALLVVTTAAFAQTANPQTADVKVIGTITPDSCGITITNSGVFDYGSIAASSLSNTSVNDLGTKDETMTIDCGNAATKVAVNTIDNRSGTADISVVADTGAASANYLFGLGTASGVKLGGYKLSLVSSSIQADGNPVDEIYSGNNGLNWTQVTDTQLRTTPGQIVSVMDPAGGTVTPIAFKLLTADLQVHAAVVSTSTLPITNNIPLNGDATLSLVYL
jgi:type 1 fimbria pilin